MKEFINLALADIYIYIYIYSYFHRSILYWLSSSGQKLWNCTLLGLWCMVHELISLREFYILLTFITRQTFWSNTLHWLIAKGDAMQFVWRKDITYDFYVGDICLLKTMNMNICKYLTYKRDWQVVTRSDVTYYIWCLMSCLTSYRSDRGILERNS
jgi:hypothetical protein